MMYAMGNKTYAGIGSRETPANILQEMKDVAALSHVWGYTLHSGGADGADTAFEETAVLLDAPRNIFLPWASFNGRQSKYTKPKGEAYAIAATVHPAWRRIPDRQRLLIARNMHQILGWSLEDPVDYVVCWTPDGCETKATYSRTTGGTGSAIALADTLGVPVFNLYNPNRFEEWVEFMMENKDV